MARVSLAQKKIKKKILEKKVASVTFWLLTGLCIRAASEQFTSDRDTQQRYSGMQGSHGILVRSVVPLGVFFLWSDIDCRGNLRDLSLIHVREKENNNMYGMNWTRSARSFKTRSSAIFFLNSFGKKGHRFENSLSWAYLILVTFVWNIMVKNTQLFISIWRLLGGD